MVENWCISTYLSFYGIADFPRIPEHVMSSGEIPLILGFECNKKSSVKDTTCCVGFVGNFWVLVHSILVASHVRS